MNINFKKISVLPSLLFLVYIGISLGCEKGILIEGNSDYKTVVFGEFYPENPWEVQVLKSKSPYGGQDQEPIPDAQVKIFDDDTIEIDELWYHPVFKNYVSTSGHLPQVNEEYTLQVQITGEKIITAKDQIPDTAFVFVDSLFKTNMTSTYVELGFSISDIEVEEGFFLLTFHENVLSSSVSPYALIKTNQITDFLINDHNTDFDTEPMTSGIKLVNNSGYLYDDTDLVGSNSKQIYVRIPLNALEHNPANNIVSEISVELRTTSYNFYQFCKDVTEQVGSENPIASPVSIHNNITEGVGNFSSYSFVKCSLIL